MRRPTRHLVGTVDPTLSLVALTIANLAPLVGVFALGWDASVIVLLYWAENLVIGAYNILKIALVRTGSRLGVLGKAGAIPFFCLHFGAFCAVHGLFLLLLLGVDDGKSVFPEHTWPGHLVFLQLLFAVIATLWRDHPAGLPWPVLGLVLSHGVSFVQNYVGKREYERLSVGDLMSQPYKRIVILHVAIIAGAFPVMALGSPAWLLCVLVLAKVGLDIKLHAKERQRAAGASRPRAEA